MPIRRPVDFIGTTLAFERCEAMRFARSNIEDVNGAAPLLSRIKERVIDFITRRRPRQAQRTFGSNRSDVQNRLAVTVQGCPEDKALAIPVVPANERDVL